MDVRLPINLTEELAEETGIHVGDGSMGKYKNTFLVSLAGHPIDDKEYYENFITPLMEKLYNVKIHLRKWSNAYGFQISSKDLVGFKQKLGLPCGPKLNIEVPKFIKEGSIELKKSFVRGLFDTDGTIYLENKNNKKYPRIQIRSISRELIEGVQKILKELDFNTSLWREKFKPKKWKDNYIIALRGYPQVNKWIREIGSNNPKNIKKFMIIQPSR